tara:strand:- start:121 stop:360 length:240 start_codon:yes stop_codon:yes gene_type:complete
MNSQITKTTNQLNRIAQKAFEKPHSKRLIWDILEKNISSLNFKSFFLPETLSIGYKTDLYKDFSEEEKDHIKTFSTVLK